MEHGVNGAALVIHALLRNAELRVELEVGGAVVFLVELISHIGKELVLIVHVVTAVAVGAVERMSVFAQAGQFVDGTGEGGVSTRELVEPIERFALSLVNVEVLIVCEELAPTLTERQGVAYHAAHLPLATGRQVGQLVAEEGLGAYGCLGLRWHRCILDLLARELLPGPFVVAAVDGEAQDIVAVLQLQRTPNVEVAIEVMPCAKALAQLTVDKRVAEIGTRRCGREEAVKQPSADLGHGSRE